MHRDLVLQLEREQQKNIHLQALLRAKEQSAEDLKEMKVAFRAENLQLKRELEVEAAHAQSLHGQIVSLQQKNRAIETQLADMQTRLTAVEAKVGKLKIEKEKRDKVYQARVLIGQVVRSFETYFVEEIFGCAQEEVLHTDLQNLNSLLRIYKSGKLHQLYGELYDVENLDKAVSNQLAGLIKSNNFTCCKNEDDLIKYLQDASRIGKSEPDNVALLTAEARAAYANDSKSVTIALTFTEQYVPPPVRGKARQKNAKPIDGRDLYTVISGMIRIFTAEAGKKGES